ncbi:MAG: hypothetical protein V3U69_06275 [Bacteroidota bacterium]
MKHYQLRYLTWEQQKQIEHILLEELELQSWYSIFFIASSKTEILISLQ